jgi:hypothetical protein
MSDPGAFKQIVSYLDQLHQDLGQLAQFAEAAMGERGWIPLPSAGSRVSWYVSHNLDKARGWRLPDLCRFYVRRDQEKVDRSVFYLASLEAETAFGFPAVLCGRAAHPMLTENEIFGQVFQTHRLRPLLRRRSSWHLSCQKNGWTRADPAFRIPIEHLHLQLYILNLFDLSSKQLVVDNMIRPLTEDAAFSDLGSTLTVESYLPPEMVESI